LKTKKSQLWHGGLLLSLMRWMSSNHSKGASHRRLPWFGFCFFGSASAGKTTRRPTLTSLFWAVTFNPTTFCWSFSLLRLSSCASSLWTTYYTWSVIELMSRTFRNSVTSALYRIYPCWLCMTQFTVTILMAGRLGKNLTCRLVG
jgi:hypothetical protein